MKTLRRGFTLIEVMVVLSILAMVAVLAYNFFGSTMKEARLSQAATKLSNDLRLLEDAYLLYEAQNGTKATGNNTTVKATLVAANVLKSWPVPDASVKGADASSVRYEVHEDYDEFPSGAAPNNDAAVTARGLTRDVCLKVQEMHSSLGGTQTWDYNQGHAEATPYPGDQPIWCLTWDTDVSDDYDLILKIRAESD